MTNEKKTVYHRLRKFLTLLNNSKFSFVLFEIQQFQETCKIKLFF